MNTEQVREILDSLNIEMSAPLSSPLQTVVFKEKSFCITWHSAFPAFEGADIYRLAPKMAFVTTVADEFEFQDWLINSIL